ncbi:hypothetical protein SAMN05660971_01517 [Halomonas cupida]|uniref:Lipid A deacylase LpxR family protein n=3 Tax=Halomonas cupida TaxID=44933 RepID=A0A1M7DWT5_9GAMM|nr:hypothetical protein SAMN05660971_01517 [Halomonas cupida]
MKPCLGASMSPTSSMRCRLRLQSPAVRLTVCGVLLLSWVPPSLAGADGVASVKMENDLFAGTTDGHYSNGVEASWTFVPPSGHWSRRMAHTLTGLPESELDLAAWRFGQQMYTPIDISRSDLVEDDRPYAGLLYGGVSLFDEQRHDSWRQMTGVHLDVGWVGPASFAEQTQKGIHELTDSDRPEGWDHQLDFEPIVNLAMKRGWIAQRSLGALEMDVGPTAGVALGNLYTYVSAGGALRVGQGLDRSYAIPAVAPAVTGQAWFRPGGDFAWFVFANVEGRFMAHNLLLDGNTFSDSHSVEREDWVGDAQLGLTLTWQNWQLSLTSVYRTHEFEGQDAHDEFGSLQISWQH